MTDAPGAGVAKYYGPRRGRWPTCPMMAGSCQRGGRIHVEIVLADEPELPDTQCHPHRMPHQLGAAGVAAAGVR
jgi:hypothetical protein